MLKGINGIHHTAISTANWEEMVTFYRDTLGFEVDMEAEFSWGPNDGELSEAADAITGLKGSGAKSVMFIAGNACIELFEFSSPTPAKATPNRPVCDHGITHIALDVTNLDDVYGALVKKGMRFHCPPQDSGPHIRLTYGRDPDGNVIELQELKDPNDPSNVVRG